MERNKIILGDAYQLLKEIPDKSIDLIVTDPPYLFDGTGGGGAFGTKRRNHDELDVARHRSPSELKIGCVADKAKHRNEIKFISQGFDYALLDEFDRVLKKINIYIWCSKKQLYPIMKHYIEKGCNFDIITWCKPNPLPTHNNSYLNDTEYCVFARDSGVKVYGSFETKRHYYIENKNVKDKILFGHPTIKPLEMIKNLIINSSLEGDLVLDPFMGSGTTAAAARETGRDYYGFEIDEEYHKIACARAEGATMTSKQGDVILEQMSLL